MKLKIAEEAQSVIAKLEACGYEAYIVGGSVRDLLSNRPVHDWDIATDAAPEDVKRIFPHTIDTGIKHGTVTVISGGVSVEVTTYRTDGEYTDARHPKDVKFVKTLDKDLARRDFTINAIAYNPRSGAIDPFGGIGDLKKGIIRAVGDPMMRFSEDALRILRGIRFAAQLGFEIEEKTYLAMGTLSEKLRLISVERIKAELDRILLSSHTEALLYLSETGIMKIILPQFDESLSCPQNNPHHIYDVGRHTIEVIRNTPAKLYLRYAALLHDIGKPASRTSDESGIDHFYGHVEKSIQIAEEFFSRFKFDNETKRRALLLIELHDRKAPAEKRAVKRLLSKIGDLFEDFLILKRADALAQSPATQKTKLEEIDLSLALYREIKSKNEAFGIKDLDIDGRDLLALGMRGGQIGKCLRDLLEYVIENPDKNKKIHLIKVAKERSRYMEKIKIKDGINLFFIPDSKFKTATAEIMLYRGLGRAEATKNSLLPNILERGSRTYPTSQDIAKRLEELYGAVLHTGVSKKGEVQIIRVGAEAVSDSMLPGKEPVFEGTLKLLFEIFFDPVTSGDAFNPEYTEQEKTNLKAYIDGLINDKRYYAIMRTLEEMCSEENYGVCEYGYSADVDALEAKGMYEHYRRVIEVSPIDIFVAGNADRERTIEAVRALCEKLPARRADYPKTEIIDDVDEVRYVTERLDVTQGKLGVGFRTGVSPSSEDYYKLMVYNSIYGGSTQSKLFNNVREKLSLAYYASSRTEQLKGIMYVSSGIEFDNYKKALDEILKQEKEIKSGKISDFEMEAAIKNIVNALRSYGDSTSALIDYYASQAIMGTNISVSEAIERIKKVTKKDVIDVAQNVKLDTVYFLCGKDK